VQYVRALGALHVSFSCREMSHFVHTFIYYVSALTAY
jgi:hypothetical protein